VRRSSGLSPCHAGFCRGAGTAAAILLVVIAPATIRAQQSDTADAEYARGVALQRRGDLRGAISAYRAALQLSPHRVDVLSNLGLVYGQLGEFEPAINTFRKALAVAPNEPIVRFNLGLTYLEAQQYENARRELRSLVIAQPENGAARHMLSLAELKLGKTDEGIADLEIAQRAVPGDIELACTLGSAYIKAKRLKQADKLVEDVLAKSDTAEAQFVAGSYYLAVGNHRRSLEHLQRAHELNSNLPELEQTLADAYALTGNQDLATQMFETELRANPLDYTANAFLGWLYLEAHDADKASTYLSRARQIKPDDPDLLFQLARLARLQERQPDAASLLERVIVAKPQYVPAHVLLAQVYTRLKRGTDAARERSIVKQLNDEAQRNQPAPQDR
jgi:tetratricopeptide (TPR) repeat protein